MIWQMVYSGTPNLPKRFPLMRLRFSRHKETDGLHWSIQRHVMSRRSLYKYRQKQSLLASQCLEPFLTKRHIVRLATFASWVFSLVTMMTLNATLGCTFSRTDFAGWMNIQTWSVCPAASRWQDPYMASHFALRPCGGNTARKARKLSSSLYIYYSVCQGAQCAPSTMFSILLRVMPWLSKAAEERKALWLKTIRLRDCDR